MSDDIKKNEEKEEELLEQTEEVVDECAERIAVVEKKLEESDGKYKRALADYQNLEKRGREERMQWIKSANKELLVRILSVLDTLMMAKKHSEDKTLHIAIQQFLDVLKSEGVTLIETTGKKFDPKLMECISVVEGKDGEVVEELRVGFLLHDSVLRPAHVSVGKKD
ncbi:MAG: nucleotide exchange factor GrpE [Candidatus Levybacteria bacterium]|nr:nucleotide exchange factor GrpE [Candidatus Levybacteria bacterium]